MNGIIIHIICTQAKATSGAIPNTAAATAIAIAINIYKVKYLSKKIILLFVQYPYKFLQ